MLSIERIAVDYDGVPAIHDITVRVPDGTIVAVVGSNGSGKTTMLKTAAGLLHPSKGTVTFEGADISRTPAHEMPRMGIALVPEGRKLFGKMSVRRNLDMGAYTRISSRNTSWRRPRCTTFSTGSRRCTATLRSSRTRWRFS